MAPRGDRQDYIHARDLYNEGHYTEAAAELSDYIYKTKNVKRREARAYRLLGKSYEQLGNLSKALDIYLVPFRPAIFMESFTGLTSENMEAAIREPQTPFEPWDGRLDSLHFQEM